MIDQDTFVSAIERALMDLIPEQNGYERLAWARLLVKGLEDYFEEAVEDESVAKSEETLKDVREEGFEAGAKAERDIADKELSAAYEKGYAACEKDTGMTAP